METSKHLKTWIFVKIEPDNLKNESQH